MLHFVASWYDYAWLQHGKTLVWRGQTLGLDRAPALIKGLVTLRYATCAIGMQLKKTCTYITCAKMATASFCSVCGEY